MDVVTQSPIREHIDLAPYTTWRVGGAARWFWEPDLQDLAAVLTYCDEHELPTYFLGRGSNTLIADEGLDGLVICFKQALRNIHHEDETIVAEAGVPLPALSKYAASLGYGGYEFLIGVPGTVGAGVGINAGLSAKVVKEVSDILIDVDVVTPQGDLKTLTKQELDFAYRESALLKSNDLVVRARFKLEHKSTSETIRHKTAEHLAERRRKQPLSKATAGSTFKRPEGGQPAGWYIDQAGLKGYAIGGAQVSEKHANWIENTGTATAQNIRDLIQYVQEHVEEAFEVRLEREVRYLPEDVRRVPGLSSATRPATYST